MPKRICLVLAVLVTAVFLAACGEHGEGNKVDPKVLAEVADKASKLADDLDNMNTRAYGLAALGTTMATVDPAGARPVLDEALAVAKDVHSPANKAALAELVSATAGWEGSDLETVAPVIKRIEDATSRVWAIRAAAGGIAILDKGRAMAALTEAAAEAEAIPDKKYRDLDLRSVAQEMAGMDSQKATAVADKIADPRVKAWALTAIGSDIAGKNRDEAVKVLSAAADTAVAIQNMEPTSELVTSETKEDVKQKVLDAQKARLAAAAAKALSGTAAVMAGIDGAKAGEMFAKAASIAEGIQMSYTQAYAISDVACEMAASDPAGADALAEKIGADHGDAKFAAMLKAARAKAKDGKIEQADLEKLQEVAEGISDSFDKAKALEQVGLAMAGVSKEAAAKVADKIEYPANNMSRTSMLRNEVLAAIAVAWSKESDDEAKKALDKVEEPRFAKADILYIKGNALADMAGIKAATDQAAAIKLYGKAAGMASDCKSTQLQWKVATGLCKLDTDKLFDMAAKIEGDDYNKAKALTEIASDWSAKKDAKAPMAWDMAAKAASAIEDNYASADMLKSVAARCAQYDKAKAAAMFAKARERVNKIGAKV